MIAYRYLAGTAALLAVCLAGCWGAPPESRGTWRGQYDSYTPSEDPLVNLPFVFESFPEDNPDAADEESVLLRYVIDEPTSLNPIFLQTWADNYLREVLFSGMMRRYEDMTLGWNNATVLKHEESEDRLVTTVHLRPGLMWHDGHPLTAHDVQFSWEAVTDVRVPAVAFKSTASQIAKVEALDDLTVRIVHKVASPTYMLNMGFPIIPKHILANPEELANDPSMKLSAYYNHFNRDAPIGNGPYRFVSWSSNDRVVVERWDGYLSTKPHFKRQILKLQQDRNVALMLFKKGELDDIWLTVQQFATQTNDIGFERVGVKAYGVRRMFGHIGWNMDGSNPFFADRRVRLAMAHAYDRDRVLREVSYNLYIPSNGIFDSEHWSYNPEIDLIEFDLDRAAELLDEAGWAISSDDGWRYKTIDGTPVKFEFILSFPLTFEDARRMAEIYRDGLRRIGVGFKNRVIENATFTSKLIDHDFQAFVGTNGFSLDPDYWRNFFYSDQYEFGRNHVGYSSERVDELFELEVREFDREKRAVYFREIQAQIYEDQPFLFMWNYSLTHAFNRRLRGVTLSPAGVYLFYPGQMGWWVPKESTGS